jgi:hypothetical protein
MILQRYLHTLFIAALFTIAKLWKQPRCPTTDEWIKQTWCSYTVEFYSAMKKNEIISFSRLARLRRPIIIHSPSYEDFRSRAKTAM